MVTSAPGTVTQMEELRFRPGPDCCRERRALRWRRRPDRRGGGGVQGRWPMARSRYMLQGGQSTSSATSEEHRDSFAAKSPTQPSQASPGTSSPPDCLCPGLALSNARVQFNAAGQVVPKLKTRWCDGTTHQVMSPLESTEWLAALVRQAATALANDRFAAIDLGSRMPGLSRGLTADPANSLPGTRHRI